jgi:hypothetical protein
LFFSQEVSSSSVLGFGKKKGRPKMKLGMVRLIGFLGVVLLAQLSLWADGIFMPPPAVEIPPPIPAQRAAIAWDGKTETLLVESSLNAKGQSFGWILPLPNAPDSVEKGTPDLLNTLDILCRPKIVTPTLGHHHGKYQNRQRMNPWIALAFIAIPLIFIVKMMLTNRGLAKRDVLVYLPLLFVLAFGLLCLAKGLAKAAAGMDSADSPVVVQLQRVVGNYEIAVLKCQDAQGLDEWLKNNGYAKLPAAGRPIVEDYCKAGWCFVASKLQMEGEGPRAPHPLLFRFLAKAPVYPMRLTALAKSPVHLKLFVFAPGQARIPGLRTDFVEATGQALCIGYWQHQKSDARDLLEPPQALAPWVKLKDTFITAATGTVESQAMVTDLEIGIGPKPAKSYRRTLYMRAAAFEKALVPAGWILFCGGLLILLASPVCQRPFWGRLRGYRRFCLVALGVLFLTAAATLTAIYLALPKINNVRLGVVNPLSYHVEFTLREAAEAFRKNPAGTNLTKAEISRLFWEEFDRTQRLWYPYSSTNPYTGNPVREEASPGNFTIEMTAQGPVVCHYWPRYDEYRFLYCNFYPLYPIPSQ